MIVELKKAQNINVLFFFLENPNLEIHIKELARRLKISPATSKKFCDLYSSKGIFLFQKKSNSIFFKLNNFDSYVKELKRFYMLSKIKDSWKNSPDENLRSIAIYGSCVSGDYFEESDVDILIISRKKEVDISFVLDFQKRLGKETNVTKMTYFEWQKSKQKGESFSQEVLQNNFLIEGEEI